LANRVRVEELDSGILKLHAEEVGHGELREFHSSHAGVSLKRGSQGRTTSECRLARMRRSAARGASRSVAVEVCDAGIGADKSWLGPRDAETSRGGADLLATKTPATGGFVGGEGEGRRG